MTDTPSLHLQVVREIAQEYTVSVIRTKDCLFEENNLIEFISLEKLFSEVQICNSTFFLLREPKSSNIHNTHVLDNLLVR